MYFIFYLHHKALSIYCARYSVDFDYLREFCPGKFPGGVVLPVDTWSTVTQRRRRTVWRICFLIEGGAHPVIFETGSGFRVVEAPVSDF